LLNILGHGRRSERGIDEGEGNSLDKYFFLVHCNS
jgi:hypothetical protein